jgi:hypothetical protein
MTPDQINSFCERFVVSCEKIALALEGIHETRRQQFQRQYPERREVREAKVTRVPSEEDRIREAQGASDAPLDEWLSEIVQEEDEEQFIGVRERGWLDAQGQDTRSQKSRRGKTAE